MTLLKLNFKLNKDELRLITNLSSDAELEQFLIEKLDLSSEDLSSVSLKHGLICRVNLSLADFKKSYFKQIVFEADDFSSAKLNDLGAEEAQFLDCRMTGLISSDTNFKQVIFKNCKLDFANFRMSNLQKVIFEDCDLSEADFYNAKLKSVNFLNCQLENTDFSQAELDDVDLSESGSLIKLKGLDYLKGAIINDNQLIEIAPALARQIGIEIRD
jgi:uncharacterized protein YjbI with pentapeptide repeats